MSNNVFAKTLKRNQYPILFAIIMLLAATIRLIHFPDIPAGFNQDEAAIAYDSYSLLHHGVDRNGYIFPVYPVSWGAGQGPFYMYFCIPFLALFGNTIFAFRIGNVLLSIASVASFYVLLKQFMSKRYALFGMLLLAIAPWNIFLSRWALDANPLPSLLIFALTAYFVGIRKRTTRCYLLASGLFGLCLYCYGSALMVVPLFLLITLPYLLYHKRICGKQVLYCGTLFFLIALPMALFLLVNYAGLPEIRTSFFSVPRCTVMRNEATFRDFSAGWSEIVASLKDYVQMVFGQKPDFNWNSISPYGIIYPFSLPLILGGFILVIWKTSWKHFHYHYLILSLFGCSSLLALLLHPNINRCHIIFISVLLFATYAARFLSAHVRLVLPILCVIYLVAFSLFSRYYVVQYNDTIGPDFYESFDDAVKDAVVEADSTDKIYITPQVNGGYLLALYFTGYSSIEYKRTVKYYDVNAEFRQAYSYGRFVFDIPETLDHHGVYVVTPLEAEGFSDSQWNIRKYKNYYVITAK